MTAPTKGVKKVSGEDWKYVGRPGFKGKIPGPVDGKDSVRRVMRPDPAKGVVSPEAANITSSKVDLIGAQSPRTMVQPLPGSPQGYDNAGRKSIPAPRKSKPVFSNTPGKVTRSPGS
jgi:hypothetical protein